MNLGYWGIRGVFRGQVARYLIAYSGAPCKEITYKMGEVGGEDWKEKKATNFMPYPNLPHISHGPFHVSETIAVCQYICEKYKPELLGKTP